MTPRYKVAESIGPDHAKHFIMLVQVNGRPRCRPRSQQAEPPNRLRPWPHRMGLPAAEYVPNPELEARYGLGDNNVP